MCSAGTFTVGIVVTQRSEAILTATAGGRLQVHALRVLYARVVLGTEVITYRAEAKCTINTKKLPKAIGLLCFKLVCHNNISTDIMLAFEQLQK